MTDKFIITEWAEKTVGSMTESAKGLIDCGLDMETAVDLVFEHSVLADGYKMRVLENVTHYRHSHRFVVDIVTGREWCATCQQFKHTA